MNIPKFKAKSTDNGDWVYGYIIELWRNPKPAFCIDTAKRFDADDIYQIIPETICQFTGLIDKDGVEIYSDDIRTDGIHKLRIYHVRGGFAIKTHYWMEDISNLHGTDELIMQPISDPQTLAWIIQGTTEAGNYHDLKMKE